MKSSSQVLKVQNASLSGELLEYTFYLTKSPGLYTVRIPGKGGGPEGPRFPNHPEQEQWMRQQDDLKEVWHLTWECKDEYKFRRFVKAVKALEKGS